MATHLPDKGSAIVPFVQLIAGRHDLVQLFAYSPPVHLLVQYFVLGSAKRSGKEGHLETHDHDVLSLNMNYYKSHKDLQNLVLLSA